jgi:hypothetical protein
MIRLGMKENCMSQRKKSPPLKEGTTRVRSLDLEKSGTVRYDLAVQMLVDYDDGTEGFLMKANYKYDWEIEDGSV